MEPFCGLSASMAAATEADVLLPTRLQSFDQTSRDTHIPSLGQVYL